MAKDRQIPCCTSLISQIKSQTFFVTSACSSFQSSTVLEEYKDINKLHIGDKKLLRF